MFPNACDLTYERDERPLEIKSLDGRATKVRDPIEVIGDFLELVREDRMSDEELKVVATALHRMREKETAA